ncbi:MAG: hypothetical protein JWS11_1221 [Cypionkella sp.]|nr:hypothetical protein [Cypionkella sp.]
MRALRTPEVPQGRKACRMTMLGGESYVYQSI